MTFRKFSLLCAMLLPLLLHAPVRTAVDIDLKSGGTRKINISVAQFANGETLPTRISFVIVNDLTRSGYFRAAIDKSLTALPNGTQPLDYDSLRSRKVEFVLLGNVTPSQGGDGARVVFELVDTITERSLGVYSYRAKLENVRRIAHEMSNLIYEQILNESSPFTSKIAYVLKGKDRYELRVADYDGFNPQTVISSPEAMMSPEWSADGNHILYVSFENDKPVVYMVSLLKGKRRVIANYKGNNSAPAISPAGNIIVALTKDGPTQLYRVSLLGGDPVRLRSSLGIDTEPDFSPDGKRLVFMSDAGGSPNIYLMELDGENGEAKRISFNSTYNVSPAFGPDGNLVAYVLKDANGYNVAVADIRNGKRAVLTSVRLADSPSFAPNGKILLFKDETRPTILNTISFNDKIRVPFERPEAGEVIDPVWGPAVSGWY